jgi:antitoxin (DNA-binding transcriptional repressor) of toxin-antitoxin stability system
MKAVGIRQLKARLSEYVRRVKAGETILVTERDEVVAELAPPRTDRVPQGEVEEVLERLAENEELRRAAAPKEGWRWKVKGLGLPRGAAMAILTELRQDRA